MKSYYLMNQNNPVLQFSVDKEYFQLDGIYKDAIMPYIFTTKVTLLGEDIKNWLIKRAIPTMRHNIRELMDFYKVKNQWQLALISHALSLSDSFWVQEISENLNWEHINFFDNPYSTGIGQYLLDGKEQPHDTFSPDICTNGVQSKIWVKENGIDYLYKFGKKPFFQEPINEVICSGIAVAFKHLTSVEYTEAEYMGRKVSKCENFITKGVEYVPALYLYEKKDDLFGNMFYAIIKRLKELKVVNSEEFIYEMIMFDSIINNTDRNLGNFGVLRDTDNGDFLCMAPIFDNGNSLWFDEDEFVISSIQAKVQPMNLTHKEMLEFIKNAYIDFDLLEYKVNKGLKVLSGEISSARFNKIKQLIPERVNDSISILERIKQKKHEKNLLR